MIYPSFFPFFFFFFSSLSLYIHTLQKQVEFHTSFQYPKSHSTPCFCCFSLQHAYELQEILKTPKSTTLGTLRSRGATFVWVCLGQNVLTLEAIERSSSECRHLRSGELEFQRQALRSFMACSDFDNSITTLSQQPSKVAVSKFP